MRVLGHVGRLNQLDDLLGGVLPEFASPAVIVIFDSRRSSVVLALGVMVTSAAEPALPLLGATVSQVSFSTVSVQS